MSRKLITIALLSTAFAFPATAAVVVVGTSEGSQTDLFNGATVTASSPILGGFSPQDAFGAVTSNPPFAESLAGGHVIFAGSGTQFINFTTSSAVTIAGFRIFASSDSVGNPFRGFSTVGLSYSTDAGASYTLLDSASYDPALGGVTVTGSFAPVTSQFFRFEGTDFNNGARLLEVDAIAAGTGAVPEPASWAMMVGGFGLLGGTIRRRRSIAATA